MSKKTFGFGLYEKRLKRLQREDFKEYPVTLTMKEIQLIASAISAFFESTAEEKKRFTTDDMDRLLHVLYKLDDEVHRNKRMN